MQIPRSSVPKKKQHYIFSMLFITVLTTTMIVTGGYGTFPDNSLTNAFQDALSGILPPELFNPFDAYMQTLSAPQTPPGSDSGSDGVSSPDPFGVILSWFGVDETIAPTTTSITDSASAPDPLGVILSWFGADEFTTIRTGTFLSDDAPTPDPFGLILSWFGADEFTTAQTGTFLSDDALTPDPFGLILSWFGADESTTSQASTFLPDDSPTPDPFGLILSWFGVDEASAQAGTFLSDGLPPPDPFGMILSLFGRDGDTAIVTGAVPNVPSVVQATLAAVGQTQTQVVVIQSKTAMATTQAPTQTLIPTAIFTVSPVPTLSSTPTVAPLVYYFPPTATDKPEPEEEPLPTFLPTFTFTPTNTPTNTPTPVPNHLVLYFGAASLGNIGPRSSADALCTANLPTGFSNYHAFLGYSGIDSIVDMPANYGLPTGLPIQSVTNVVIANNWTDLMDGSISVALNAAGVSPTYNWWSGAEDEFGTHLDGITPDCNDWTSNSGADGGNEGSRSSTTAAWMDVGFGVACNQLIGVLCIAY